MAFRNSHRHTLLIAGLTASIVGSVTAFLVVVLLRESHPVLIHGHASEALFHQWVHANLNLTPEQQRALSPIERKFEEERLHIRREIEDAAGDLASAIRVGEPDAPALREATDRLNHLQGELQRLAIDHLFAMRDQLDPAQAEKLLRLTETGIRHDHRN